ncbi:MAG TPA: hypothetical protein VFF59_01515 [Anaerolineae bacterium]|nr:hypothetical protein [Anaerolineae bacterium]
MLRKHWVLGLLAAQVVVFLLLISLFLREPAANAAPASAPDAAAAEAPQTQTAVHGTYVWSYAAKFVCGWQQPTAAGVNPQGEFIVKPGNYATDINIHNPNYKQVPLRKKFIIMVQNGQAVANEPGQAEPRNVVTMTLGADYATMDDCNNLWKYSFPTAPPGPMPLTIGYLVILSPVELDVDAVYTAGAPGAFTVAPSSTSIDVERVTGKRVFLPFGVLPN